MAVKTLPYNSAEYLKDAQAIAEYLEEAMKIAMEDSNPAFLLPSCSALASTCGRSPRQARSKLCATGVF
jgi:DNA-binding phage protein